MSLPNIFRQLDVEGGKNLVLSQRLEATGDNQHRKEGGIYYDSYKEKQDRCSSCSFFCWIAPDDLPKYSNVGECFGENC